MLMQELVDRYRQLVVAEESMETLDHALTLAEHNPNRTIFKVQSCFSLKEYTHLLIQHQLDKQLCRLT